jgi:hypothetical protein
MFLWGMVYYLFNHMNPEPVTVVPEKSLAPRPENAELPSITKGWRSRVWGTQVAA